jgi:hypothetical protein
VLRCSSPCSSTLNSAWCVLGRGEGARSGSGLTAGACRPDVARVGAFVPVAPATAGALTRVRTTRRTARVGGVALWRVRRVLKVAPWALPRRARAVTSVRQGAPMAVASGTSALGSRRPRMAGTRSPAPGVCCVYACACRCATDVRGAERQRLGCGCGGHGASVRLGGARRRKRGHTGGGEVGG